MDAFTTINMLVFVFRDLTGILLNSVLAYLILKKTSKELKSYSFLILSFAICDFIACLFSLFTQSRVVPSARGIFLIAHGPCQIFGEKFCYISTCVMLHCYPHGLYTLLFSFYYRYHVLSRAPLKTCTIVCVIFLYYIPCFLQLVFLSLSSDSEADVKKELKDTLRYDISSGCLSGILQPTGWKCLYTQIHMCVPVVPICVAILLLRRSIIVKLKTRTISGKTLKMHAQLLKAITIQACMPILFVVAVVNFILSEFDIYHSPVLEFLTLISIGFIAVLTPLTSLYFIAPYRKWIIDKLRCRSRKAAVPAHFSITINTKA